MACPTCTIQVEEECIPCPPGSQLAVCAGCPSPPKESFFKREVLPAIVTGTIVAIASGITAYQLQKHGVKMA